MLRWAPVLLALEVVTAAAWAAPVEYDLEVVLDPSAHRVTATGSLHWTNPSSRPTDELQLHLYMNAFSSPDTTFLREWSQGLQPVTLDPWGWIRIDVLRTAAGVDLLAGMEPIRPDDGNPDDATVVRVPLPEPLAPGARLELEIGFTTQLPELLARSGVAGDFHMVAQWYPKPGVLGEHGWSCHQYHALGEFFADFARFRVSIEVPTGWLVAATGVEAAGEETPSPGRRRQVWSADRVHDFAFSVAPASLMERVETDFEPGRDVPAVWLERAVRRQGLTAAELELPPTSLCLLVPRSQRVLVPRMVRGVRLALAWLGLAYGPYPYPRLTVVSPPLGAEGAAGMEYPTLIVTGASLLQAIPPFDRAPWIESVTGHELAHQYFYGIVASDEGESPWLDEGLTQYAENLFLRDLVADRPGTPALLAMPFLRDRLELAGRLVPVTVARPAWGHRSWADYATAAYTKPALALATLEGLVGPDLLARGLREYVERYAYRHPGERDLEGVLSEVAGRDLGWFFDRAVRGDDEPDWAVLGVRQGRREDGDGWQVVVELGRPGGLVAPVEVEIELEDGSRERRTWDDGERWTEWRLETSAAVVAVTVDPDGVWQLETRRDDNRWRRRPSSSARNRLRSVWALATAVLAGLGGA